MFNNILQLKIITKYFKRVLVNALKKCTSLKCNKILLKQCTLKYTVHFLIVCKETSLHTLKWPLILNNKMFYSL